MRSFAAAFTIFCVGTVLAQGVVLGYLWSKGVLDRSRVAGAVAALQGIEPPAPPAEKPKQVSESSEQPSLDDREQARAIATRHLELREQGVSNGLDRIQFESLNLKKNRTEYDELRSKFDDLLKVREEQTKRTGKENIRLIWETIKSKQAKEQILQMYDAGDKLDVVDILTAMPIAKRAKIIAEFKTEDEVKKLEDLLKMIRQGMPESAIIENTRSEVNNKLAPNKPQAP